MDYKEAFEEIFRFHVGVAWSFLPDKIKDKMTLEDMVEFFETESKKQTAFLVRALRQSELSEKRDADRERTRADRLNREAESYIEQIRRMKEDKPRIGAGSVPQFSFLHDKDNRKLQPIGFPVVCGKPRCAAEERKSDQPKKEKTFRKRLVI